MSDEELRDFFNLDDENGEDDVPFEDETSFDDEVPFDDAGFFDDTPEFPEDDMGPAIDPEEFESIAGEDGGGVSRTFMIVAALIALGVIAIIILIVLFALSGEDELTDNQKTATQIAEYNATQIEGNNRTLTALAVIDAATETAVFNAQQSATAEFVQQQTQQALNEQQTATSAALQAATLTLEAEQTATAAVAEATASAATATQRAIDSQVIVRLRTDDNMVLGDVGVRLYRDDGDGQFNPGDRLITGQTSEVAPSGGARALAYGEVGEGTLSLGETHAWTFTGSAGDVVSISAEAAIPTQMDTFLELFGPGGNRLTGDDDSGEVSNALIESFELPADGTYTIEISSIAGQGDYRLRLNVAIDVPGGDENGDSAYRPNPGAGIVLVRQGATPTPEGDTLVETLRSSLEGIVDFGSLEPGTYWLELEFDTLPPDLQALLPPDEPLVLQIIVPEEGPVGDIEFVLQLSTPTPGPTETDTPVVTPTSPVTAVPGDIVTLTPTAEASPIVVSPTALPDSGFFSDIGDGASDIGGTSGLTVLAIAAAGLIAVVVIARKMRTSG